MNRRRSIVWSIVVVLIIFLLWQLWLIAITTCDIILGIPSDVLFNPMNLSRPRIAPIVHQVWKTSNLSSYPIKASYAKWKKIYPDYTLRLWTDADLDHLISSKKYSYLEETYRSYPFDIQRADLARLVILHHQGGIYADLDVFPPDRSIDKLRLSGASFIIPRSSSDSSVINHFLASEQHSKIIDYILHRVPSVSFYRRILFVPYVQVFSTGSAFLTRTLRQWLKTSSNREEKLWILSSKETNSYIAHSAGRSWHSFDGYLFNLIVDQSLGSEHLFICLFVLFIFFSLIFLCFFLQYRRTICLIIRLMRNK